MKEENNLKKYQFLSGASLKIIAVLTMFIDHFAAVVLMHALMVWNPSWTWMPQEKVYTLYTVMRIIGRTAFPIYCFLLVEGFFYTRNRSRYTGIMLVFALLSEVPFDLAFRGSTYNMDYQNVFWTLGIGLLSIWGMDILKNRRWYVLMPLPALIGCFLAYELHTDYSWMGVLLIVIFYCFHTKRIVGLVLGYLSFFWEAACIGAFVLLLFYNGKRGKLRGKYFFYLFYPIHLLILYGITLTF